MKSTRIVQKILSHYEGETPGVKANLNRMLMTGKLGGTGKMIILPVDQGFEHGPARSFAPNPAAYDPHYHYQLAIDAGLNAYAAPLGMLEAGADTFAFFGIHGNDTIRDFEVDIDQIRIPGANLSFQYLTMDDTAQGTVIHLHGGDILIEGVSVSQLDAADFLFS